jgi:hypothetical protein
MLRYRCHVAELTVYEMVKQQRTALAQFESILKEIWALNEKYPLGDDSTEQSANIAFAAMRRLPEHANKTDAQLLEVLMKTKS